MSDFEALKKYVTEVSAFQSMFRQTVAQFQRVWWALEDLEDMLTKSGFSKPFINKVVDEVYKNYDRRDAATRIYKKLW